MKLILKILFLALLVTSCGGTWENDDSVWEKNFGEEKPNDIEMINSYFWKSSHWTYECISYMEINYNQKWLQKMIKEYELEPIIEISSDQFSFDLEKPNWFVPKSRENYVLLQASRIQELKLYIDKKTSRIFYTYVQL